MLKTYAKILTRACEKIISAYNGREEIKSCPPETNEIKKPEIYSKL